MTRVVVATAEPFAAYHLAPLVDAAARRGIDVSHLIPINHPTQGTAFPVVAHLGAALDADVVVVTGGELTAWTEAVAYTATQRGVPTVFAELAYLGAEPHPHPPQFAAVLAASGSSVDLIERHLGADQPPTRIVGSALLDDLPSYAPAPGSVLLLSTVSSESPDGGAVLSSAAEQLAASGWDVTVRLHPREPAARWADFQIDSSPSAAHAAATAAHVVGYPGTAFIQIAAVGAPVWGLATEPWMLGRVPAGVAAVCTPVNRLDGLAGLLAAAPDTPPRQAVEEFTGPVGGSANRFWCEVETVSRGTSRPAAR